MAVLAGGLSHEREVSLRSGRRLAAALRAPGASVREWDADAALVERLRHGAAGRGRRRAARRRGGERLGAGRAGAPRRAVRRHPGRPAGGPGTSRPRRPSSPAPGSTPRTGSRSRTRRSVSSAPGRARRDGRALGLPLMLKPDQGGSASARRSSRDAAELPAAMVSCLPTPTRSWPSGSSTASRSRCRSSRTGTSRARSRPSRWRRRRRLRLHRALHAGRDHLPLPGAARRRGAGHAAGDRSRRAPTTGLRDVSRMDAVVDAAGRVQILEVNVSQG